MPSSARPIAIVQGAESAAIQRLLSDFAERVAGTVRVVGVIENGRDDACGPGHLRNIADGFTHALFQDLGAGSEGCALDPAGAVEAGEAVRRQIEAGCDLVVLSKFGKLEADNGSGLLPAFVAAVEAGVPVLTSVSPRFEESWGRFAEPLFVRVAAEMAAIEAWWDGVRAPLPQAGEA